MKQLLSIKIVALIIGFFAAQSVVAQSIEDIRINEILVYNVDGFKDDYGHASSWIELHNTGHGSVNIGGCYLKVNGTEYRIPKISDMVIPPRGYKVFFADGETARGPFYTNFTLENAQYIAFYASDNKYTAVDSLVINPDIMKVDVSYGWFRDQDGVTKLMNLPASTPGTSNDTLETVPRSEHFRQADPIGIVLAVTAIAVVLTCLTALYLIFAYLGKFHIKMAKRKDQKAKAASTQMQKSPAAEGAKAGEGVLLSEELAAIAIALYKYSEDLHDRETTVLTINRAAKAYSPWSSKIYGLNQYHKK